MEDLVTLSDKISDERLVGQKRLRPEVVNEKSKMSLIEEEKMPAIEEREEMEEEEGEGEQIITTST